MSGALVNISLNHNIQEGGWRHVMPLINKISNTWDIIIRHPHRLCKINLAISVSSAHIINIRVLLTCALRTQDKKLNVKI